ncbi:MAG TPA: SMC family ATPase, partial [Thermoplasmata archaeon]|nr:SMC family ATPase [Thermoplasmata archaeon]
TEAVRDAIGMDHVTFFASVFSCQRDLDALADSPPAQREGLFMSMLGIERVDRALEAVREQKRTNQALLQQIDGLIAQGDAEDVGKRKEETKRILASTKKRFEEASLDLAEEEAALVKAQSAQEEHERKRAAAASEQEEARGLEERLRAAEARVATLDAELEDAKRKVEQAAVLEPRAKEYDALAKERESMESSREKHLRLAALIEEKTRSTKESEAVRIRLMGPAAGAANIDTLEKDEEERSAKERETRAERESAEKVRAEAAGESEALGRQRKEEETHLSDVRRRKESGVCPTCERPLGPEHRQLEERLAEKVKALAHLVKEAESRAREADARVDRAAKLLTALDKKRRAIEIGLREASSARSATVELERQRALVEKRAADIEREISTIGEVEFSEARHRKLLDSLKSAERARAEWLRLADSADRAKKIDGALEGAKEEAKRASEDLKRIRARLAATGFSAPAAEKAKTEVKDAQARARAAREAVAHIEKEMVKAEGDLRALEQRLSELEGFRARAMESRSKYEELVELESLVKEFRGWLVSKVRPYVSDVASGLFAQVTDGRYSRLELDEKYEPRILDGNKSYPLARFSGGERDLASLCLRLGVARLLFDRSGSEINLLVLDEIFGSQDPERRRRVLQALSQLSTTFRQILLITHIDDVKEAVDSVIRVERGEEGSRVVVE